MMLLRCNHDICSLSILGKTSYPSERFAYSVELKPFHYFQVQIEKSMNYQSPPDLFTPSGSELLGPGVARHGVQTHTTTSRHQAVGMVCHPALLPQRVSGLSPVHSVLTLTVR